MVYRDETSSSWLWPLSRSLSGDKHAYRGAGDDADANLDGPHGDAGRGFLCADWMEMGLAREVVPDELVALPARASSRLRRFRIVRSRDRQQYRLLREDGCFVMYARARRSHQLIEFYLYDPRDGHELFDANRPAFILERQAAPQSNDWVLRQSLLAAAGANTQRELALVRYKKEAVGDGMNHCMDVILFDPTEERSDIRLQTRRPSWNQEIQCLTLDFKGRKVVASAKNFQLELADQAKQPACQHGKVGANSFCLDFRHPLTVVQAFGVAMTSMVWE